VNEQMSKPLLLRGNSTGGRPNSRSAAITASTARRSTSAVCLA
jgi:hypothetical protein